jgi:arginyl-tRNA synthetase
LPWATRQSADNPVFYVQYVHARVTSLFRTAAEQHVSVPPWDEVDFRPLRLPEEQTIIKRLLQYPSLVAGAARAREPHRVAYYLSELAGSITVLQVPPGDHRGSRAHPGASRPRRGGGAGGA